MNSDNYITESTDGIVYSFTSIGPKGDIPIIVQYEKIENWEIAGKQIYNLGFGALIKKAKTIIVDDSFKTNNGDRDKILSTVGKTVFYFSEMYPNAGIFAQGNKPVKNRLYKMVITGNYKEVTEKFDIYGRTNGKRERFENGTEYNAFLTFRK